MAHWLLPSPCSWTHVVHQSSAGPSLYNKRKSKKSQNKSLLLPSLYQHHQQFLTVSSCQFFTYQYLSRVLSLRTSTCYVNTIKNWTAYMSKSQTGHIPHLAEKTQKETRPREELMLALMHLLQMKKALELVSSPPFLVQEWEKVEVFQELVFYVPFRRALCR